MSQSKFKGILFEWAGTTVEDEIVKAVADEYQHAAASVVVHGGGPQIDVALARIPILS